MSHCPLCLCDNSILHYENKKKVFFRCNTCKLIFAPKERLLNTAEEVEIYDLHENDPNDINYVNFMERILTPLRDHLPYGSHGIDFGCGPGPVVKTILSKENFKISEYDPFYVNDKSLLDEQYDFLIATEVIEHIYETKKDFELMLSLVKKKGVIALMTSFYSDDIDKFSRWGYHNDPTHVRFFNEETFDWMAKEYGLRLIIPTKNIAFFIKE
ncbi:class I SAM-dependent methyltransferase [Halobacteriovorax sp. JY17]|uniref:class I SAM-dependent methyltransferase n=1 Tax=Halobacteriovorax sp. JY17 TaxID=2014617 RepID=UPI000C6491D2|nr:class I SAM-dependent methyltransferase [Halobacteriovorax sp. JY17]PIK14991.1 MAG: hypothetical protein CES88_11700 [Halobacteriovorax sp. JY17]